MMKKYILLLIITVVVISCEDENDTINISNRIEFTEMNVEEISYKTARVSSKIPEVFNLQIDEFGHCWSLDSLPDINDSVSKFDKFSTYPFTSELKNLENNKGYFVRAYFKSGDVIGYSKCESFSTLEITKPSIRTTGVGSIRANSSLSGGEILNENGSQIIKAGVCWNKTGNPLISDSLTIDSLGLGLFQCEVKNLEPDTKYYLRAYATNEVGTSYGETKEFYTRNGIPDLSLDGYYGLTTESVKVRLIINDDGGADIIEKGLCWNQTGSPTIEDSSKVVNSVEYDELYTLYNLNINTEYFIRFYVVNEVGTFYSETENYTTLDGIPEVKTKKIENVISLIAIGGGEVISDEGFSVTSKGICWNQSGNPTINDSKTVDGDGGGEFTSQIENLESSVMYYIRAYAINENGVGYGREIVCNSDWYITRVQDYDGNWYSTVQIGDQLWLRENLRTTHYSNGEKLVFAQDGANEDDYSTKYYYDNYYTGGYWNFFEDYGLLYTWSAAMNGNVNAENPTVIQGVCPDGWHIPSNEEWLKLENYLGGEFLAGGKLKEKGSGLWDEPNVDATNESGFTAVAAGKRRGSWHQPPGHSAIFWTSSESNVESAKIKYIRNDYRYLWSEDLEKSWAVSVRCIKD